MPSTKIESESPATVSESEFSVGEICFCKYMTKGLERWYKAKILKSKKDKKNPGKLCYFVHYNGWNKRFDFWARLDSLVKDNDDNTKIAADLETGMYDTRMKGRTIEEVLEAESENEEEMQAEFERKQEQKEIEQQAKEERELDKKRKRSEKEAREKSERQKTEEQRKRTSGSITPNKLETSQKKHAKISPLPPMIRKIPLAVKKVDKSDAIESFRKMDDHFDVIEAPHDAEDVLRGDNFDPAVTEELIAVIEADMKKMKSNLMILPTKTNILDIFNNYVKWHLTYEIIQGQGVSRRIAGEYESTDTRSYCVNFRPLSYKQELGRTIQVLWPILALLLDSEFFADNLLYESENEQFEKLISSAKFDDPAEHMQDKEIKKPTRKSVLEEQCTISTESRWFLKENDCQLQKIVEEFVIENDITEDLTWIFEDNLGESFSFVTSEAFTGKNQGPSPIHIYGARHLLRFFGHWIYKVGFIDKFISGTIPDWQLEAADRQIESLMRFILFTYKDQCLPNMDMGYAFNPKK